MAGRKTTLDDVARLAGVSLATVDRVLNGRGGVSVVKEELILSAARRLRLDRSLARRPQRMLRVAVLIQAPTNPFHGALKQGWILPRACMPISTCSSSSTTSLRPMSPPRRRLSPGRRSAATG